MTDTLEVFTQKINTNWVTTANKTYSCDTNNKRYWTYLDVSTYCCDQKLTQTNFRSKQWQFTNDKIEMFQLDTAKVFFKGLPLQSFCFWKRNNLAKDSVVFRTSIQSNNFYFVNSSLIGTVGVHHFVCGRGTILSSLVISLLSSVDVSFEILSLLRWIVPCSQPSSDGHHVGFFVAPSSLSWIH